MTTLGPRVALWLGFPLSLLAIALSGFPNAFNVYALEIKTTFNYTQSEVELVASLGVIGLVTGILTPVLVSGLGHQCTYLVAWALAPSASGLLYLGTVYRHVFHNWASVIGVFQLLTSAGNIMIQVLLIQIGVNNFQRKHCGKLVGVYTASVSLGKIVYSCLFELHFVGDLGGFYKAVTLLWVVVYGLCLFIHRPVNSSVCDVPLLNATGGDDDAKIHLKTSPSQGGSLDHMLTSPYFLMMQLSGVLFYACTTTAQNNLTTIADSAGFDDPFVMVYIMTTTSITSRLIAGAVVDFFSSDPCGFVVLFVSYFLLVAGAALGMAWFSNTSVVLMGVLFGLSNPAANTVPQIMLLRNFGRRHFAVVQGVALTGVCVAVIGIQTYVGFTYDSQSARQNPSRQHLDTLFCRGRDCFYWTFVLLTVLGVLIATIQGINVLCRYRTVSQV